MIARSRIPFRGLTGFSGTLRVVWDTSKPNPSTGSGQAFAQGQPGQRVRDLPKAPKDQHSSEEDLGQGLGGVDCAADWPTDLMIHRRGAENAERTHKNLCELGVSAVNPTGKVKFVGQPDCAVQDSLQGADGVQRHAPRCVGYEQAE